VALGATQGRSSIRTTTLASYLRGTSCSSSRRPPRADVDICLPAVDHDCATIDLAPVVDRTHTRRPRSRASASARLTVSSPHLARTGIKLNTSSRQTGR